MKLRVVVVTAIILTIINCGCLWGINNMLEKTMSVYIVQVGRYKQQVNADEMINNLNTQKITNFQYQDGDIIVINDIYLDKKTANENAKAISDLGISCVVKEYRINSECLNQIKKKEYTNVYQEIKDA